MSLERFGIRWNGSHEPMATPMDDGYWTPWHIAEAEIAALRQEIATGRGQYHRDYAAECDALLAAKDKVIAALQERCGRLAKLVETKRAPTLARDGEEKFGAWLRAALDCATHNDLAPAAKEQTDGR